MRWPVPAVVLLGALIVVPWSVAAGGEETTITVISVTTSVRHVDRLPKGVSDGDMVSSTDTLLNAASQFGRPSGARVGSDHGASRARARTRRRTPARCRCPAGR